jgi:hypothetical protein
LAGAIVAYQIHYSFDLDVGTPIDQSFVRNFHDPRVEASVEGGAGRTFRWSDAYGYVDLAGTGGGAPFDITLTLNTGRPDVPVSVIVNGETLLQSTFSEGWRTLDLSVDASHAQALASRDLVVEIRTPGYPAPDDRTQIQGVMLDSVRVVSSGSGFVTPSITQLLYMGLGVLLVYLLLGRMLFPLAAYNRAPRNSELRTQNSELLPFLGALLAAIALVALLAWYHSGDLTAAIVLDDLLAWYRVPSTSAVGQVALPVAGTFALSYILLVLVEPIARRISGAPGARWGARVLASMIAVAFLVRFGAANLPQVNIIDLPWHMKWLRELLIGNWQALYFPGQLSQVPREWGLAVLIPKSPLFYFVAAPLAVLPWSLETSVKAFACLLDVSLMGFCYWLLARYAPALGGWRAGLWAAFAYACNPLSYRALAYGILPTILAQWLTVASFTVLLALASRIITASPDAQERPRIRGLLFGLFILLAASLVAFPTIAVFNTFVLGLLALYWLWRKHLPTLSTQHSALSTQKRLGWTVVGVTAAAWALALVSYYGQYVAILINTTLPALLNPQAAAAEGVDTTAQATSTVDWSGPLDLLGWTAGYMTSLIPLLSGLAGLALLWWAVRKGPRMALFSALMGAWMLILPVFMVANYKVDMIGKHIFYTVFPLSVGAGIFLWGLARRGGAVRWFAYLSAGALAWTALAFWAQRLVQASF